jgi:hypothetical protein
VADSWVDLRCQTNNANSVTLRGIQFLTATATLTVNPIQDTTYTCVATGQNGQSDSRSLIVRVSQPPPPNPGQNPVVSVLGGFVQIQQTRIFTLDASASFSPVGNSPLTYFWTSVGQNASIAPANSATPTVELGVTEGTQYLFTLTVTDSKGNTSTRTITVNLATNPGKQ